MTPWDAVTRGLAALGRRAPWCLAGGIAVGLAVPPLAALLRPAISGTVVVLLVSAFLRIDVVQLRRQGEAPLLPIGLAVVLLVAGPLAMLGLTQPMGLPEGLRAALVLMAGAAPITSATAFALLLGLEAPLSLAVGASALVLVPVTIPVVAFQLLDLTLAVSPAALALRLAAIIAGAVMIAALVRRFVPPAALQARRAQLDGISVVCLMVFAIGVMDGVAAQIQARPLLMLGYVVAAFAANLALQAIAAAATAGLGRRRALTIALSAGNRNMGMLLAALPASTDQLITVFFALGQIPIYLLPGLMGPVYRRLAPREEVEA